MILSVVLAVGVLGHFHIWGQSAPLFDEKTECTPISSCPHLNELTKTKKNHFGTRTLLTLLYCDVVDQQIRVKCISPEKVRTFIDKADLLPDKDNCGLENTQQRISGGEATGIDEYPWIALLRYNDTRGQVTYGCHGNLINQRYVLTAAHCVEPNTTLRKYGRLIHSVVLGEYDIRQKKDCLSSPLGYQDCNDEIQELMVESFHVHPDYETQNYVNDIALIRMERDVAITDFIKPICLPPVLLVQPFNETLWIGGWGNTEEDIMNPVKVKAKFGLRPHSFCRVNVKLTPKQYCASSEKEAKTCPGDSGGPLMMRRKIGYSFRFFLVGVDSLGVSCAGDLRLSIYTQVTPYIEWIITTLHK